MTDLTRLVRPNILALTPYSCARNEYSGGEANVFLDANESPYGGLYNRYPDPLQRELRRRLSALKGVGKEQMFLGNGSDEAIDLIMRVFCEPGRDNVVAIEPTYGMYEVCAGVNDVEYRPVPLGAGFRLEAEALLDAADEHTKAVFLCSPNNPTGNSLDRGEMLRVIEGFGGIVVADEAYGDFSSAPSLRSELPCHDNLVVLNTLSKAWASAALRVGMAFASKGIVELLNRVKYPYNISLPAQREALRALDGEEQVRTWVRLTLSERERVLREVAALSLCLQVFPTDANFFLARVTDARGIYEHLLRRGVVVRDRSRVRLCEGCLRVTIGTREENEALIGALKDYEQAHIVH